MELSELKRRIEITRDNADLRVKSGRTNPSDVIYYTGIRHACNIIIQ